MTEYVTLPAMSQKTAFSDFRKNSGKTLDAVAEVFGVDRRTIIRWEKGMPPVPVKRLEEAEKITGIPRHKLRPDLADIFGPSKGAAA
ncbi:helix-turn-helix domain-containing protein [Shinella zoogloeoides]